MDLPKSAKAWGSPDFPWIFKNELAGCSGELPLQKCLASSSYALTERIEVMLIDSVMEANTLKVRAGIFFEGILGGCSCADDPTPVEEQHEYCEVLFEIDRNTGATSAVLLEEENRP